ncbi:MAG: hypothetical protein J6K32_04110 [Clostridia bacterium]|nr:hypothetical protein [Clostridia bacterium]
MIKRFPVPFGHDRRGAAHLLLTALGVFFIAHAFCFFNLTYSGPGVMLNAQKGLYAQLEGGLYLQPFYFALRGGIASPLMTGMLCALYLAAALLLLGDLLCLRGAQLYALCAVFCAHPSLTSLFASSLHTADAHLLALPLVCAGLWCCRRLRFGFAPGAALIAAAMAADSSAFSLAAGLTLLAILQALMSGERPRPAASFAAALAAGAALYGAGFAVLLRIAGLDGTASLQMSGGLIGLWLYPLSTLFAPLTAYPRVGILLRMLLMLAACLALLRAARRMTPGRAAAAVLCALLLPAAVSLPIFSAEPAGQLRPAYALLDVLVVLLLLQGSVRLSVRRAAAGAIAVLCLGCTIFSNQVYLKKCLEFEATLSVMTRVLDRAEDTPGYQPGATPAAIIGTPQDAAVTAGLQGFEHLKALDAAAADSALASQEDMAWYLWEILGYPINLVSDYEREQLAASDAVQAMPVYPAQGCCAFIGDTLVIHLAE